MFLDRNKFQTKGTDSIGVPDQSSKKGFQPGNRFQTHK